MSAGPTPGAQPPTRPYRYQGGCPCRRCQMHSLLGPVILITVGLIFLAGRFSQFGFAELWPVILLVIGVMKLLETSAPTDNHRG